MSFLKAPVALIFALLLLSGSSALAQDATPPSEASVFPEITITATDTGFEVPAQIVEGRYLVTFENTGKLGSGMFFWKLPEGVTIGDLQSSLPTREPGSTGVAPEAFYESFFPGAPGYAEAGGRTQAIVDLPAGSYVVLTEEGAWATPLEVLPAANATPSALVQPVSDLDIRLQEFAFDTFPTTIAAGQHVWKVFNGGKQPHQMIVGKVPDGMTVQQVIAGFQPAPSGTPVPGAMTRADFHAVGGIEIISRANTAWSLVDLTEPGTYAVVCLVPDEQSGMLHVAEGMASVFTVGDTLATPAQ